MNDRLDPLQDNISSIELIDYMGDDLRVVNSARVSLRKRADWAYHFTSEEIYRLLKLPDQSLIRYLAIHGHWTPFSHPQLTFHFKMPLFVARQWFKHQIGTTRNEVSRRYVADEPEFFMPTVYRQRPTGGIKQGSGSDFTHALNKHFSYEAYQSVQANKTLYELLLAEGVAPEQARIFLPLNTYTEFYETMSLATANRIAGLRAAEDAQLETRHYAEGMSSLIAPLFPFSWKALQHANERPKLMEALLRELCERYPNEQANIMEVLS